MARTNMAPVVCAYVRPANAQEVNFPHVLLTSRVAVSLKTPSGVIKSTALDRVWQGNAETVEMLDAVHRQLCHAVDNGQNATLHVIGARRSGKSYCLFGPRDGDPDGIVLRFAEAYYDRSDFKAGSALIELAVYQVCDENVYDLLNPKQNVLQASFSPTCGPCLDGLTDHMANDLEEFLSLIQSALSAKAAYFIRSDECSHSAHLCIRCSCSYKLHSHLPPVHEGVANFVEIGANLVPGMLSHESDVCSSSS